MTITKSGKYNYLIGRLQQIGMTRGDLAHKIGLTPSALSRRLQGHTPITVRESLAMLDAAELPIADWAKCFAPDRLRLHNHNGGERDA